MTATGGPRDAFRDARPGIRVLASTRGRDVPSARFRVQQYAPVLREHGVDLVEARAVLRGYPPRRRYLRPAWGAGVLAERFVHAARSWSYDVMMLQREMISTLLTVERFTRRPRVLDVDDAIWVFGGRDFTRRIAALADRIICGNSFIADQFSRHHRDIVIIPTAVDVTRYVPMPADQRQPGLIGWSGSGGGLHHLYAIEPALAEVMRRHPHARLRVIAEYAPKLKVLPPERVEFVPWSRATEVRAVQEMSVGVMPLPDAEWERGKCSYKMLLYASCGVPSVVSPVGMNAEILGMAQVGLAATSIDDWVDALDQLLSSETDRARLGATGRQLAVERFSTAQWGVRLAEELRAAATAGPR